MTFSNRAGVASNLVLALLLLTIAIVLTELTGRALTATSDDQPSHATANPVVDP